MIQRWSAILSILLFAVCASSRSFSQTNADWDWVNRHFGEVLDSLMPMQRDKGFYVAYRSHRDFRTEVPEYWFIIGYDSNPGGYGLEPFLSAHVRAADASSIYDQMMAMHRNDAHEDPASMAKKIWLKKSDFTEEGCPSIKKQIEQLQQLQSKVFKLRSNVIVLHPMNHEFHIQASDGDMNVVIWDDEYPLVKWALQTRRLLESCGRTR
jgi:hypothetical protein